MNNSLVIIDGHSLMNRAYYAIRKPMITKSGIYTHGIYGFLNMLNKIISDYDPEYIAVAFDRKQPTFRHLEYSGYKAGRKKMPLELNMQFPLLHEVLEAMNITILEIDGYEADDILGTVSFEAEERGISTFIITGDKDALQLASDKTTIIYTKRGTTDFDAYDKKKFTEVYGFTPAQFVDFKGLRGDTSDNIPGIPGIGEKTASKLIIEYGSVEELISRSEELKKGKLKDSVEEYAQQAIMSKRLAAIMRNVPIETDFEGMKRTRPDYAKLIDIYKRLEFNSFLKKLASEPDAAGDLSAAKAGGAQNRVPVPSDTEHGVCTPYDDIQPVPDDAPVTLITDAQSLRASLAALSDSENIWLKVFHDDNHLSRPEIMSVCVAYGGEVLLAAWKDEFAGIFADFFGSYTGGICGHNLKSDYYALMANRAAKIPENKQKESIFNTRFDTALAAYLISPQKKSYDLSECIMDAFCEKFPSEKEISEEISSISMFGDHMSAQSRMGRKILSASSGLVNYYAAELDRLGLTDVYEKAELPLEEVLASMEEAGIRADTAALKATGTELSEHIEELKSLIWDMAGEEFNINSPKQLGEILFDKLQLPFAKKTKTGYSTNADVLAKLKDKHPIIPLITEYRMLTKLNGTYVDGLLPLISEEGFIHTHFQQTATATGRLSSTEPNLQNIPVRHEAGRVFRKVFISSSDENVLVGADYSQVELRVAAHLSGDENMISAFGEQGKDIHTSTAAKIFEVDESRVTAEMRRQAKAVNFGVIYGISAFGLSQDLNITQKEAKSYIDEYFKKYPSVKKYMDAVVKDCRDNGYVTTILGRRREISEIHSGSAAARQQGERLAMNTPVQGSAADIIKLAMIQTYRRLIAENCRSRLVLQIHDELIVDAPKDEAEKIKFILEESMENAVQLKVPLVADVGSGRSWYELK